MSFILFHTDIQLFNYNLLKILYFPRNKLCAFIEHQLIV